MRLSRALFASLGAAAALHASPCVRHSPRTGRTASPRCDEAAKGRRDALRTFAFTVWAGIAGNSVYSVANFPPPQFKAVVSSVYAEAQRGGGGGQSPLRVLEIGAGRAVDSVFEQRFVSGADVVALDVEVPDAETLRGAEASARANGHAFRFDRGDAAQLPYADGSFDAVVCSLTLCSVGSADAAVAEVLRVLRPGGRFGFVEHVAVEEEDGRPLLAATQRVLDPVQQALAHNCHLRRRTDALIVRAFGGGRVLRRQRMLTGGMWPVSQQVAGVVEKAR